MATLSVVPHSTPTLFDAEQDLLAIVESAETVTPEQEAEYIADLSITLQAAVAKRDRVQAFLCHLESQALAAKTEIARLQERKRWFEAAAERMELYVCRVIESLGVDGKGKFRKLEGNTITFAIKACPASVEILDQEKIPIVCKLATVKMPAAEWETLLDSLDLETRARVIDTAKIEYEPSKTLIKQAFDAKETVEGADLNIGEKTLVRK